MNVSRRRGATVIVRVEWDLEDWELTYGTPRADQRADVVAYILAQLNGSAAAEECGFVAMTR